MDIELLSKMVGSLILTNDKVGLPGLGTFVSELVPATFSDRGYTINPPYKRLVFSQEVIEDNLLVNLYASDNSIETEQARTILRNFLQGVKAVLQDRKTVVLPGLGRLRATRTNSMFFVSDPDLQIYPDGFALGPVNLRAHEQTPETFAEEMKDLEYLVDRATLAQEDDAVAQQPAQQHPAQDSAAAATPGKGWKLHPFLKFILIILIAFAVLLASLAVLGRICPGIVDGILYSAEELSVLNA